jgi:D-glycero-D-manno-heptose 1,7-bisphosphate phosphatase
LQRWLAHTSPEADAVYHGNVSSTPSLAFAPRLHTVFLDRDGVLNEKMPEGAYVRRWQDFRVVPRVPEALARLRGAGLRLIVLSNQRGIARGLYSAADVDAIHARFQRLLEPAGARIDAFFICPHEQGACNCRKPLPGLFEQASARFPGIAAATSVMIGDSLSDMEFARALDMPALFIEADTGRPRSGAAQARELAEQTFLSLSDAADALLATRRGSAEAAGPGT